MSETLLAVLESPRRFATATQTTAWVYGILRHKLVDQLRQQGREMPAGDALPEPDTRSTEWFVGGPWWGVTSVRPEPDQAYARQQCLERLASCGETLPALQRDAFLLREVFGDEPEAICRRLGVSEGHLWVLVHRARVRLRMLMSGESPLG